jgi:hypothetical protein
MLSVQGNIPGANKKYEPGQHTGPTHSQGKEKKMEAEGKIRGRGNRTVTYRRRRVRYVSCRLDKSVRCTMMPTEEKLTFGGGGGGGGRVGYLVVDGGGGGGGSGV